MNSNKRTREWTRRKFLGRSAAGVTALGFSSTLLNTLLFHTGCKTGAKATDLIVPEDVLKKAVELLMAKGADFGEVFVERSAFDTLMSDDRKINTTTLIEKGVGIRGVKEGKTFYAFTASFDPDEIFKTAQFVADAAAQGNAAETALIVDMTRQSSDLAFPIAPHPDELAADKKIEMVQGLTDRAWSADERVNQISQYFQEIMRQINIATSSGKIINQLVGRTLFYALTYLKDKDGNLQLGMDSRGAYAGMDFFTGENALEVVVDKSVERAKILLEAIDSPRGKFPVVLGPGGTGVLFHESCGHGMEADLVYKGSNYKTRSGNRQQPKG